jgi:hypothetical protein
VSRLAGQAPSFADTGDLKEAKALLDIFGVEEPAGFRAEINNL